MKASWPSDCLSLSLSHSLLTLYQTLCFRLSLCTLNFVPCPLNRFQIASALAFVHKDLKYAHCALNPSSIFVNKAGDFKLGSFELAHKKDNVPSHFLANFDILPTKYRPKELSQNASSNVIDMLMKNPIHSIDSWCFGCVMLSLSSSPSLSLSVHYSLCIVPYVFSFELFNSIDTLTQRRSKFTKPQQLSNLSAIPHDLQSFYKRLLATKPASRITLPQVLDSDFITQNSLVQTSTFLEEISIKNDVCFAVQSAVCCVGGFGI